MSPESRKRLRDAHGFCSELTAFLEHESRDTFDSDRVLRYAVQMALTYLGEALSVVRRQDDKTAELVPNLHRFVGMRNHLVHGYDAVNDDIVWHVATKESPLLATALAPLLVDDFGGTL